MAGSFEEKKSGLHQIFILKGYIEKEIAQKLLQTFKEGRKLGLRFFIFDFSEVTLINSFALSCFLDLVSEGLGESEINFYFCAIPESCYYGMSAVGLVNCVTEFSSLEQAKTELQF
ncbi:MAG: STAS domain-containing protein [Candidatus Riflebacteria bacterium]